MAENETASAVAEPAPYQYAVKVEDVGPGTKKVSVEIPRERIAEKLGEQFKEVRQQAAIPGFRLGHAPQKLVEKRFASDVKDQVRRNLIGESYEQALEKNNLQVIGEPEFADADKIELPEDGPLNFSFTVEVQPTINLPELKNLHIRKPKVEVTDAKLEEAMTNLREQQGALVPVEGRGVQAKDYVTADVHIKSGDKVLAHQHGAQLVARPGRVYGIQVDDLDKQLEGANSGETRSFAAKGPEAHPNEEIKGHDVTIEVTVKEIKSLQAAEINQEFLEGLGFANEQELRDALKEQMVERVTYESQEVMRDQVETYLLQNVQIELPTKLSARQTERVIGRKSVDLMMRGMPREQVETAVEAMRGGVQEEAVRELKLFFILQKVAAEQNVEVDEAELNGRIAMLAAQRGRRPEKVKQEMSKDGSLANLYLQMREQKAIDKVLESAQIEEAAPEEKK